MGRAWIVAATGLAVAAELLLARRAHAQPAGPGGSRGGRFGLPAAPQPVYPSGVPVSDPHYTLQFWWPIIHRMIAGTLPDHSDALYPRISEPFARKWLEIESGGNPTAVGDPGQLGEGSSEPAEIGLGQLYNPDDFRHFGISPQAFRAYAPAAAPLAAEYRQAQADAHAAQASGDRAAYAAAIARQKAAAWQEQSRTRALTAAECDDQVRWTLLAKIDQGMHEADALVARYGLHWSVPDYWKLVKAPHALPAILSRGLPAVVHKLGRAPASWAEFRSALGMEHHDQWKRALDACETCGNAAAEPVS